MAFFDWYSSSDYRIFIRFPGMIECKWNGECLPENLCQLLTDKFQLALEECQVNIESISTYILQ